MKQSIIALSIATMLGLSACGSTKVAEVTPGSGATTAVSEQRLSSDFKRQGIKLIYDRSGNIESIEVHGYAPVWGSSSSSAREAFRVAELEAKKAMNDFINKETIRSSTSVAMISRNLEKANDNKTNNFSSNRSSADVETTDAEVAKDTNQESNTAVRNDALTIASRVSTTITTNNQGIISGMYLVEGDVINSGQNVHVLYRWDKRNNTSRTVIRNLMMQ